MTPPPPEAPEAPAVIQFRITSAGGREAIGTVGARRWQVEWDAMGRVISHDPAGYVGAIQWATRFGSFAVEWDAAGQLISHAVSLRDRLTTLSDDQRARAEARRATCAGCDQNKGMTALTVRCDGCGCTGLSLLNGRCKLGKWPII